MVIGIIRVRHDTDYSPASGNWDRPVLTNGCIRAAMVRGMERVRGYQSQYCETGNSCQGVFTMFEILI
jgi:hypothetical protein